MKDTECIKLIKEAFENYDKRIAELCKILGEQNACEEEAIKVFYEEDISFIRKLRKIIADHGVLGFPEK